LLSLSSLLLITSCNVDAFAFQPSSSPSILGNTHFKNINTHSHSIGTSLRHRGRPSSLYSQATETIKDVPLVEDVESLDIPSNLPSLSDIMKQSLNDEMEINTKSTTATTTSTKSKEALPGKPWRANYHTSTRTQKRIQQSAKLRAPPLARATNVLQVLHSIPPQLCNPSNIVCALTLTAKIVPDHKNRNGSGNNNRSEFRELLHATLDILAGLVEAGRLNTRQLSNAAWAIAKHYSMDKEVLPPSDYFSNSLIRKTSSEQTALRTLEEIAEQLIDIMEGTEQERKRKGGIAKKPINEVEMSMVCWAYAIVYPRNMPAGWELPRRLGKMKSSSSSASASPSNKQGDEIAVETFNDRSSAPEEDTYDKEMFIPTSTVDRLYDAIAIHILQPQAQKSKTNKNKHKQPGISRASDSMIYNCSWKELSTVTWSLANRGYCQSEAAVNLILNLSSEAMDRIDHAILQKCNNDGDDNDNNTNRGNDILPRDISEMAWALGVMQSDNYYLADSLEHFVDAAEEYVKINSRSNDRPLSKWKSADCLQMAVALAHGRLDRQFLLKEIYSEALQSILSDASRISKNTRKGGKQFQDFELVILLWVQARLYLTKDVGDVYQDFVNILPSTLLSRMNNKKNNGHAIFGPQEQANIAWSLTVLEKYESPAAQELLQSIFTNCSASCQEGISLEHAHQLWQSIFILQDQCPDVVDSIDDNTITFLKEMWDQEKTRRKKSSARHKALSETLDFMEVQHYNEHDEDIDVALVLKTESSWTKNATTCEASLYCDYNDDEYTQRVAVEFDGPSHFTKIAMPNPKEIKGKVVPPRALGHTVLKYKLLKKQGWTIVRIPFYEFDRIPFWASMERQRYVQRKLKTHANLQFSIVDVSEYKAPVPNRKSRFD